MAGKRIPLSAFKTDVTIPRATVYEHIVRRINEMLESGELEAGDKIPPERRLAEAFGVSRNSVREAIRVLSEQGILESRPGCGTFVKAHKGRDFLEGLASRMAQGRQQLRDVLELRLILEPSIAALAAQNARQQDLVKLEDLIRRQEEDIYGGGTGISLDEEFHAILARLSGNKLLDDVIERIRDALRESRDETLNSVERRSSSMQAHKDVLRAIASGDATGAKKAMRNHLRLIARLLFPGENLG
ncbi:FadR/GntR family transcriptional regulator [Desulfobaculum bizertense]|uniref:Transcriptional regulator, GntR family n=1 Tax=Desulfobaculum bizertense DSM 18034 TaxID=1121442 RepID=A0A1T4WC70_9BACT|nr:FadR/GntR family transcriptional regulator [Desulfobaculum bizertense]UIJ37513.1 FadR family transcriptional regulator [Desulfobaculum bizertense]SKA74525.1 transcriptional regulator, GntR family [Desulfobaculum bizertense DSM 18034]